VDTGHVKKLRKKIGYKGELDPILVIKLGEQWVCVDGHHRLAAYEQEGRDKPIKCEWFKGTVREAYDASMGRNDVAKLEVPKEDRYENAWKRVLLGFGSKKEIVKLCSVGEGTVALMRRVKARYDGNHGAGLMKKFRTELGDPLEETHWSKAHLIFLNVEEKEVDKHAEAVKLAKRLRSSVDDRLSFDPAITAKAVEIYDHDLVKPLLRQLQFIVEPWTKATGIYTPGDVAAAKLDLKHREKLTDADLREALVKISDQHEDLEKQADLIEAELQRREVVTTYELETATDEDLL
jgi:hypothetical protein